MENYVDDELIHPHKLEYLMLNVIQNYNILVGAGNSSITYQ